VGFGQSAYQRRSETTSTVLDQLFKRLRGEGVVMAYTMDDFKRGLVKEYFGELSPEEQQEVLKSFPPETHREILDSLPPETRRKILDSLAPETRREILDSLPPEQRREMLDSLPPEERLAGLSPEQIQKYLDQVGASKPPAPRKRRRKK
jgi:Mg/Co/Ni transporter MgtE